MNIIIPPSVYPSPLMVSFGESDKQLRQAMKAYGVKATDKAHKLDRDMLGVTATYDNGFTLIRLREVPTTPEGYGVLSHEIFHAAGFILEYAGGSTTGAANESYAYLIEFITREILKAIKEL
jgi:hypothetical protein